MERQLVIIGGGAAGFFCAVNAARLDPQLRVIILEKTGKLLSKVKVSGGGRCNTTHACFDIPELASRYPRGQQFLKKAFHWFSPKDTIAWFAERGVSLQTESDGRMFPDTNRSQTIIDCLLHEAERYKVQVRMHTAVEQLNVLPNGAFSLVTNTNETMHADYVCVASGGYPKPEMFQWLLATGHAIEQPVPSLFTFNIPSNAITQLMGVSVPLATIKIMGSKLVERGPLLITHWGISGPVVLRLSAWGARELEQKGYDFQILVNWLGNTTENALRDDWQNIRDAQSSITIGSRNPFGLPTRLWHYLLQVADIHQDTRWSELPAKQQNKLITLLTAQSFSVKGKTTFKEEFVTCGGIKLNEIDPNTMQSRKQPGLFFAGEIMDVDGITGGFNFQHAWTSGFIAATAIARQ